MSNNRIAELDGVRGVASLFVLVHHAFPTQLFWAWIWMEAFFVLSGFLITTILLRSDIRQPLAIRNFLIRRGLRIWPVYYVGLLGAVAIWAAFQMNNPAAYPQVIWWKHFLYLQFTEGYFTTDPSYIQQYAQWFRLSWSLAAEEQYYLVWPLLIVLVGGRRMLMLAFCVAILGVCLYLRSSGHALNLLLTRGDGFAFGSVLALLQEMMQQRGEIFRRRLKLAYAAALAAGLAVILPYIVIGHASGAVVEYDDIARYGNWTLNVLAAAALFFGLLGLLANGHLVSLKRMISIRPLTWLGEVSYAVYMFQSLVFLVMHQIGRRLGNEHVALDLLAIAISIALGPLSQRFIEEPFNRLKRHFPVITRHGRTQDAITDMPQVPDPAPQAGQAPPPALEAGTRRPAG